MFNMFACTAIVILCILISTQETPTHVPDRKLAVLRCPRRDRPASQAPPTTPIQIPAITSAPIGLALNLNLPHLITPAQLQLLYLA